MKLMYRGSEYNYEPAPVDMGETGILGNYRGRAFTFAYPRHIPVPQFPTDLQYRGVSYHKTATGEIESVAPQVMAAPAVPPVASTPGVMYRSVAASRHALMQEVAGKHRENIQRRLQHRLEVARAKGDEMLINQLEREMQYK